VVSGVGELRVRLLTRAMANMQLKLETCEHTHDSLKFHLHQARIQEFLVEVDDMDEEKIGRGLGAAIGPQRGPAARLLVGVKGAKPPIKVKVTLFHELYSDFALSK
jgi:hypothetical protein